MKIVKATAELYDFHNTNKNSHIAKCARVCYASKKDSINDKFVEALWHNKHYSMYRHVGVYYIIPYKPEIPTELGSYINIFIYKGTWYVSTNNQVTKEYFDRYKKYQITFEEAEQNEVFYNNKMIYYTICINTGIDITREYNRKSPNAIAEQSTRYVDFNKKIGIRFKKCHWMYNLNLYKKCLTWLMCKCSEWFYKISRSKFGLNLPPEDARWILPLDTMSKAVYTYTIKDWEYIINMRLFGYTGKPHPDAKIIAYQICSLLEEQGYKIKKYNS